MQNSGVEGLWKGKQETKKRDDEGNKHKFWDSFDLLALKMKH